MEAAEGVGGPVDAAAREAHEPALQRHTPRQVAAGPRHVGQRQALGEHLRAGQNRVVQRTAAAMRVCQCVCWRAAAAGHLGGDLAALFDELADGGVEGLQLGHEEHQLEQVPIRHAGDARHHRQLDAQPCPSTPPARSRLTSASEHRL